MRFIFLLVHPAFVLVESAGLVLHKGMDLEYPTAGLDCDFKLKFTVITLTRFRRETIFILSEQLNPFTFPTLIQRTSFLCLHVEVSDLD